MEENQEKMSRFSMLDDTLLIQARDELGETDEIREESILTIQEWIENEEKPYPLGIPLKFDQSLKNNNVISQTR